MNPSARPVNDQPLDQANAKLNLVLETMREMSRQTDPQAMVRAYGERMQELFPRDAIISISRRDMDCPWYRITRASRWDDDVNPWTQADRLPQFRRGLLGTLLYADQPLLDNDFQADPDDPAFEYLGGFRSLLAVPLFDQGKVLNMVVFLKHEPNGFSAEQLPDLVWMSNLFGRATHNLVLMADLRKAYRALDEEMLAVADIQRSLLPRELPTISTMSLAAHYQTSQRAGGDYYDFFPLPDGRWGILIADVSGHGTPAAVMMAITHTLSHALPGPAAPAGKVLETINRHLCCKYTQDNGTFITALYAIYDPVTRQLDYACAGHHPPRLKSCVDGSVRSLTVEPGLPLGVLEDEQYPESQFQFRPGDQVVFYTDGITEARNAEEELYGLERLDSALRRCRPDGPGIIRGVLSSLELFTDGRPADDDRTLVVAKIN